MSVRALQLMEERDVVGHVRKVAPVFQAALQSFADHPLVGEVRGVGLLGAIELVADKATGKAFDPAQRVGFYCSDRGQAHGLINRPIVDSMAFCPPLIIEPAQIEELFARFAKALDETWAWVQKG